MQNIVEKLVIDNPDISFKNKIKEFKPSLDQKTETLDRKILQEVSANSEPMDQNKKILILREKIEREREREQLLIEKA